MQKEVCAIFTMHSISLIIHEKLNLKSLSCSISDFKCVFDRWVPMTDVTSACSNQVFNVG